MLVISRKKDTSVKVQIGELEMDIFVHEIRGDRVRLGFDAPEEIGIFRHELWVALEAEKEEEAQREYDAAAVKPIKPGEPDSSESSDVGEGDDSTSPSAPRTSSTPTSKASP